MTINTYFVLFGKNHVDTILYIVYNREHRKMPKGLIRQTDAYNGDTVLCNLERWNKV